MTTQGQGGPAGWASMAVITTTGLDKASRQQVQNSVEAAGGTYSAALHKGCTHLIASTRLTEATDKLAVAAGNAARWKLNVVTPAWWCDSMQQGKLLPEQPYKHPMQPGMAETAGAVQASAGIPNGMPQLQAPWHVHFSQIPADGGVYPPPPAATNTAATGHAAVAGQDTSTNLQQLAATGAAPGAVAVNQQPAAVQQRATHKRSSTAGSPTTSSKQLLLNTPGIANTTGAPLPGGASSSSHPGSRPAPTAAAGGGGGAARRHTEEAQPSTAITQLLEQLSSSRFLRRNSTQGYSRQQEGNTDLDAASTRRPEVAPASAAGDGTVGRAEPAAQVRWEAAGPGELQANMLDTSSDPPDAGHGAGAPMVSMDFRRLLGQLHQALAVPASPDSISPKNPSPGQAPAQQQQQGSPSASQPYMSGDVRALLQQLRLASSGGAAVAAVAQGPEPSSSSPAAATAAPTVPAVSGQLQGHKQQQQQVGTLARPAGLIPSRSPSKDSLLSKASTGSAAAAPVADMAPIPDGMRPVFDGAGTPPQHLGHARTFAVHTQAPAAEGLPQRRRHTADLASQRPRRTWEDKGALVPNSSTSNSSGSKDTAAADRAGGEAGGAQGQGQDLQLLLRQLGRWSAPGAPLTADTAGSQPEAGEDEPTERLASLLSALGGAQQAAGTAGPGYPSEAAAAGGGTILSLDQLLQRLNAAAGPSGTAMPGATQAGAPPAQEDPAGTTQWSTDTATLAAQLMAFAEQAPQSTPESPDGAGQGPLGAAAAAAVDGLQPTLSTDVAQLLAAVRRATGDNPPSAADAAAAAAAAAMGGAWSPGASPPGVIDSRSSPSTVVQGTPSAALGSSSSYTGVQGTPCSSGGAATSAPPTATPQQQQQAPQQQPRRRSSRPSLLLLLPEGAGSQTSPEQQLAALSSLNPVSPKLMKAAGSQTLAKSVSRAGDSSSGGGSSAGGRSPAAGRAQASAGASGTAPAANTTACSSSNGGGSCSSTSAGTSAVTWSKCVVHLDPALPEEVTEQLQQVLQAAGATLTASAHLGSPVTLVVTEPVTAANWLHLLVDVVSPAWCLAQLQQQGATNQQQQQQQQQQLVRLSPDVARAVWRTTKQRSMVARASTAGAAAASAPQPGGAAAGATPGEAGSGAVLRVPAADVTANQAVGGGWAPPLLLPGVSWSVLDPPEEALTAEELESIVLQGVTGGITLLLPQGCSPLLGVHALPLAADTPAGALCAGSLLRAIHGFYQATIEAPAALLERVVGGAGGAGAAGGLSQLGSQVVAASAEHSPQQSSKGGGVASGAGMMKVTRGALLGAGVCFAGLQRVQGSSHAAVYRLLLN